MECPRCQGFMVFERFSDFFVSFHAWKCINCGSIMDRTITNNRRRSLAMVEVEPAPTVAAH